MGRKKGPGPPVGAAASIARFFKPRGAGGPEGAPEAGPSSAPPRLPPAGAPPPPPGPGGPGGLAGAAGREDRDPANPKRLAGAAGVAGPPGGDPPGAKLRRVSDDFVFYQTQRVDDGQRVCWQEAAPAPLPLPGPSDDSRRSPGTAARLDRLVSSLRSDAGPRPGRGADFGEDLMGFGSGRKAARPGPAAGGGPPGPAPAEAPNPFARTTPRATPSQGGSGRPSASQPPPKFHAGRPASQRTEPPSQDRQDRQAILSKLDHLKSELLARKARPAPGGGGGREGRTLFRELITARSANSQDPEPARASEGAEPGKENVAASAKGAAAKEAPQEAAPQEEVGAAAAAGGGGGPQGRDALLALRHKVVGVEEAGPGAVALRALSEVDFSERRVVLKGSWACAGSVRKGSTINVVCGAGGAGAGAGAGGGLPPTVTVDDVEGFLIEEPDTLLSGTRIINGVKCERRAVLDESVSEPGVSSTRATLKGNLIHELVQDCLAADRADDDFLRAQVEAIIGQHQYALYETGMTVAEARAEMEATFPTVKDFAARFRTGPGSTPQRVGGFAQPRPAAVPSGAMEVLDIEECFWSPKWGLKGVVDVTAARTAAGGGEAGAVVPVEIKTGKPYFTHAAQVALYTLLLGERYAQDVPAGVLWYSGALSAGAARLQDVGVKKVELNSLLQMRNRIAGHLKARTLPEVCGNARACTYCDHQLNCMLRHKVYENGTAESSGAPELFAEKTAHLTPAHADFLKRWIDMLDLERQAKGGGDSFWLDASEDDSLRWLKFLPKRAMQGKYFLYSFMCTSFSGKRSFRPGEHLVLSGESGRFGVGRGWVETVEGDVLTIRFRHAIPKQLQRAESLWRIDKPSMGSLIQELKGNVYTLFEPNDGPRDRLRKRIVDLEAPRRRADPPPAADALLAPGDLAALNRDQRAAMQGVLGAEDFSLVLGMPGTGKTTTIALTIKALVAAGKTVLVTSYTNSAVDNILMKLEGLGVAFLRLGHANAIHERVRGHSLGEGRWPSGTVEEMAASLAGSPVVGCTCLGTKHAVFRKRAFDVCIVDEASQIMLPAIIGPLLCARSFVLVGDHNQLPPLVVDKEAEKAGLGVSLFKRLCEAHPAAVVALTHQYRMNAAIMALSNELVYDGKLQCGSAAVASGALRLRDEGAGAAGQPAWVQEALRPGTPVVFVSTDGVEPAMAERKAGKKCDNPAEAAMALRLAQLLAKAGVEGGIGLMSPYREQVAALRTLAQRAAYGDEDLRRCDVEALTIDSFQGRDKEVIIISLVKSNAAKDPGGLLGDWRRINVALTRAKHKLILLGSEATVSSVPLFQRLLGIVKGRGGHLCPREAL